MDKNAWDASVGTLGPQAVLGLLHSLIRKKKSQKGRAFLLKWPAQNPHRACTGLLLDEIPSLPAPGLTHYELVSGSFRTTKLERVFRIQNALKSFIEDDDSPLVSEKNAKMGYGEKEERMYPR